ncbi:GNAT family N-acetyltransferase [Arthrobacter sp. ISL-72]|uniref:GNAT family N-acetyltransferase n=1 Tax=Arthrobacter sp. ISL-72 TaxID=2819114 RepID=UPI001BEAF26D|nr:GNAT family N-acetyltransferase [Arthrobacter sp. ISL-72]MBT2595982.1 hypothetical protein [Arthrobacter sp. ISL-72]
MSDELVIRQVWPVPRGHSLLSSFEASEDFTQACWQANEVIAASPSDHFYTFTKDGEEIVRLIVVDHPEVDPGYGVPEAGNGLEIDFMEVADGHRRQGLGTQAIELVRQQHPGRSVFARPPESEDAFWQSLGWDHVRHAQDGTIPRYSCSADRDPRPPVGVPCPGCAHWGPGGALRTAQSWAVSHKRCNTN